VLLPACTLAALQIRTLLSLEQETRAALRESLRQTIRAYDDSIQESAVRIALKAIEHTAKSDALIGRPDLRERILREVLEHAPAVDMVSAARRCECPGRFALVVERSGAVLREDSDNPSWPWGRLYSRAQALAERSGGPSFIHVDRADDEDSPFPPGLYAFARFEELAFAVRVPQSSLFALVSESTEAVEPRSQATGAASFRLVRSRDGRFVDRDSADGAAEPELREALGAPLDRWALAAYYPERSIADIARDSLRYNLILLAAVLGALILGVALSLRAFSRQAKLAEMKSAFVSNVSHEMRTPLALISLYSETLELERIKDPAKVADYHRVIHRESKRLAQMVNNILDFSRIESGRASYRMEPCNVQTVIEEVLRDYEAAIRSAGFRLDVALDSDLPLVRADQTSIAQAVLNLLDNAVKYSPEEKAIQVSARRQGDHVAVEIDDRGVGIPHAEQARIFDAFHRAGDHMTSATRGSGLGLALAKHAVTAHGGRIEVESRVGVGSRFTILLPAHARAESAQLAVARTSP